MHRMANLGISLHFLYLLRLSTFALALAKPTPLWYDATTSAPKRSLSSASPAKDLHAMLSLHCSYSTAESAVIVIRTQEGLAILYHSESRHPSLLKIIGWSGGHCTQIIVATRLPCVPCCPFMLAVNDGVYLCRIQARWDGMR